METSVLFMALAILLGGAIYSVSVYHVRLSQIASERIEEQSVLDGIAAQYLKDPAAFRAEDYSAYHIEATDVSLVIHALTGNERVLLKVELNDSGNVISWEYGL